MSLVRLPPKLLSCRQIDFVEASLAARIGLDPDKHTSAGIVTCDQDDAMYVALDHATKHAEVDVVYAKSFYAGAAHASGPLSGEIIGIIAGADPAEVAEGLWALRSFLLESVGFYQFADIKQSPAFFPQVIGETGRYLAPLAGIEVGAPLAYLIAPPAESIVAIDAALKSADVTLRQWFGPPTETNFGGAYLSGALHDVELAAQAFTDAIEEVARSPLNALRRPERERF